MSGWLRFSDWFGYGPIQAVLFSIPTEGRTLRVLIAGNKPPYRCVIDMLASKGADDWPPNVVVGPDPIREIQDLLSRALRRDTHVTAPEPRGFFAPLGKWVDDRVLGRDRIILGRVELREGSLSVLLVGDGGSPGSRPPRGSPWSQPRERIVVRMRWGSDLMHGTLVDAAAEAMIHALGQALAYPLRVR